MAATTGNSALVWFAQGTTYRDIRKFKYKHESGTNVVECYAYLKGSDSSSVYCQFDIGGQTGVISGDYDPEAWGNVDVDVSGLTPGTVYDVTISLKNAQAAQATWLGEAIGFASES